MSVGAILIWLCNSLMTLGISHKASDNVDIVCSEMMGLVSTQRRSSYGQPWSDEEICMSSYEVCRHHQLYPGMGQGPNVSPQLHVSQWEGCIIIYWPIRGVHDPSDEFLAVTIQGDNSDLEHLYQESFIVNSSQQASSEKSMDSCVAKLQISGLR